MCSFFHTSNIIFSWICMLTIFNWILEPEQIFTSRYFDPQFFKNLFWQKLLQSYWRLHLFLKSWGLPRNPSLTKSTIWKIHQTNCFKEFHYQLLVTVTKTCLHSSIPSGYFAVVIPWVLYASESWLASMPVWYQPSCSLSCELHHRQVYLDQDSATWFIRLREEFDFNLLQDILC